MGHDEQEEREGRSGPRSGDLDKESADRADGPGVADMSDDVDEERGFAALADRVKTDWRDGRRVGGPWVTRGVLIAVVGWFFVKPAPPKRVTIAAGPKDGAYYAFAQEYARTFAASGVTLEVRETAGTVENY